MDALIIITLIVGGLLLFGIEVFLIPGISIAGIGSACCILYAIYYGFFEMSMLAGFIILFSSILGLVGVMAWFMKSKTVDRLSLKKSLDYKHNPLEGLNLKVGDKGVTVTRLTLIGNVNFNGKILEVHSDDGFIDEKSEVEVTRIVDSTVYVKNV